MEVAPPRVRKADLNRILARNEFNESSMTWWDKLSERMSGAIERWLRRLAPIGPGGDKLVNLLSVLLALTVIVLFVVLLAYVLSRVGRRALDKAAESDNGDIYAGPDTPRLALDEAARLASAGDFRSALRLVYLAALLKLDERDLIRFDRTGTNWEYLSRVRGKPELYGALRPVTLAFDRKWYGHEPATESDYRAFIDAYRNIESPEVAE
jgi:hypothetical protein